MSSGTLESSPRMSQPKRRSNLSSVGSSSGWTPPSQSSGSNHRNSHTLSRRSSLSSLRSVRTVATTYSVNSTATSASVCSAKFERSYAAQSHMWSTSTTSRSRRPSISSQFSVGSMRNMPPHVVGKKAMLQKQFSVVEDLLRDLPNLVLTETGSVGWLLAHERHLLRVALKYDERARAEWEAAQDWQLSAQEGPVSKIFVTQPSRFGLTPEQHRYRIGQAMTLGNNALDLWRFSDLNYQDSYKIRGAREKLQAETEMSGTDRRPISGSGGDGSSSDGSNKKKDKAGRKDFQTWLKEVTKNDTLKSVIVKDDGTLDTLDQLSLSEEPLKVSAAATCCKKKES